jgi:hypothetical protein
MDENPQRPSAAPAPEGNAPKAERAWKALAFFAAVFALAAFRLALQASLPVYARPSSGHDDLLLADYAANWAAGNAWGPYFGDYLATALEKLPGFSLFLGVGRKIGVPFSLWFGLAWVSSCFAALAAFRPILLNRIAATAAFAWILLCPPMLDMTAQRLYCLGLVGPVALLLASSALALVLRRDAPVRIWLPWLVLQSAAFAFYGILRADAQWTFLLVAGAAVLFLHRPPLRNGRGPFLRSVLKDAVVAAVPFLAFVSASECLRCYNERHYGVHATNDFTETGFADACLALMRIRPEAESPKCYVSHDAFRKAFRASPALAELEPEIERGLYTREPCPERMANGELMREYYAWNLRWAASGLYREGAGRADGFFRRCAEEIRTALDDGRLEKRDALVLSPFTGPIDFPRLRKILLHSLRNGFGTVLSRKGFQAKIPDVEDSETLRALEDVAGERIPYRGCDLESVRVRAFFLPADSSAKTRLLVSDGKGATLVPKTVFRDYPAGSGTDGRASARPYADFAVTSEMMDLPSARLSVSLNRRTVWEGPLASAREMSSAELEADVRVDEKRRDGPPRLPLARRSTAVANRLLSVSRFLSPVPCAALLVHALLGIRLLFPGKRFRTDVRLWLFGTGLLLVAWAVLFVCSANFFEAMPDGFPFWYAVGAYAVLDVFAVLSFLCLLRSASGRDERP